MVDFYARVFVRVIYDVESGSAIFLITMITLTRGKAIAPQVAHYARKRTWNQQPLRVNAWIAQTSEGFSGKALQCIRGVLSIQQILGCQL